MSEGGGDHDNLEIHHVKTGCVYGFVKTLFGFFLLFWSAGQYDVTVN